ncbi:hypothetical protein M758_UG186100, partial [Ceratodon purpureus]
TGVVSTNTLSPEGKGTADLPTRDDVLAAAQIHALSLSAVDLTQVGHLPPIQKVPGLYYILKESPLQIMDKELLLNPKVCMETLYALEEEDDLSGKVMASLGHLRPG